MSLVAYLWIALAGGVAAAQPPSSGDVAQARELFGRGVTELRAERWVEACDLFQRSNALIELAETHLNLAACSGGRGRLLDESEHLRAFIRLAAGGSAQLVERARARLSEIQPRIPRLIVVVPAPAPGLSVTVDGEPLPPAAWGGARPVNPGRILVEARAVGYEPYAEQLDVGEGAEVTARIRLVALAAEPGPPVSPEPGPLVSQPAPADPAPSDREPGDGSLTWLWITAGAGAVAAAVIIYFVAFHDPDPDPASFPDGTRRFEALGVSF